MYPWLLLSMLFVSTSCGGFKLFDDQIDQKEREVASMAVKRLLLEENQGLSQELDERLSSLHSYNVIAQKNLADFDRSIAENSLSELYQSRPYLNLLAVKTQIDDIEKELVEIHTTLKGQKKPTDIQKMLMLENKISEFAGKSLINAHSMENISEMLDIERKEITSNLSLKDIEKEYSALDAQKEFQIYEKNIEHLSHLMEMNIKSDVKKFRPSESKAGNVSGQEFPEKVWALTFSNGPSKNVTEKILANLKAENLKASFFQTAQKSHEMIKESKLIRDAGMEIGTYSYSNKELTKVGILSLDKEITGATESMEKDLKLDVQFFRLPYGAGAEMPVIRQLIAKNKLIHAFWNIDSLDWAAQSPDKIVERTKKLMKKTAHDAGIVLFHDVHERSVVASSAVMKFLNSDSRRTCTLGEIVKDMNEGKNTICSKNSF